MILLMFLTLTVLAQGPLNLIKIRQLSLSIPAGFTLLESQTYQTSIYAIVANQSGFYVMRYDWINNYTLVDQSAFILSQTYLTTNTVLNPKITVDATYVGLLLYYIGEPQTTAMKPLMTNDLTTLSWANNRGHTFIFEKLKIIDAYFQKKSAGGQSIIINPFHTNTALYNFSILEPGTSGSGVTRYSIIQSTPGNFVATLDTVNNVIYLTQIIWTAGSPYNTFVNANTKRFASTFPINSICFQDQTYLLVHTQGGEFQRLNLTAAVLTAEVLSTVAAVGDSDKMIYDTGSQEAILLRNVASTQTQITRVNFNTFSFQKTNTSDLLYLDLSSSMFSLSSGSNMTIYKVTTCSGIYNSIDLTCSQSVLGCAVEVYYGYCSICDVGYYPNSYVMESIEMRDCQACMANCQNCTDNSTCLQCNIGFNFDNVTMSCKGSTPTPQMEKNQSKSNVTAIQDFFSETLYTIINASSTVTDYLPSARSIFKPFFFVLISSDDLFPYMYHERNYGATLNSLFDSIHAAQTEKWSTYDQYIMDPLINMLFGNRDAFINQLDTYGSYTSSVYLSREGRGEGLLISAFSFMTTNLIASVLLFIVCRIIFGVLFNYRVSRAFRPFSFWPFIVFFALEGNLQILIFYSCSVFKLNFFREAAQKSLLGVSYLALFLLVFFSVAGYFMIFAFFGRLSKYFADNVKPSLHSIFYLTIEYGLKNLLLGITHALLRQPDLYYQQFSVLALIELICITNHIIFLKTKGLCQLRFKIWLMMIFSMLRIMLLGVLSFQQSNLDNQIIVQALEKVIDLVIKLYVMISAAGIVIFMLVFIYDSGSFLKQCIINPKFKEKKKDPPNNIKQTAKVQSTQKKSKNILKNRSKLKDQNHHNRVGFESKIENKITLVQQPKQKALKKMKKSKSANSLLKKLDR